MEWSVSFGKRAEVLMPTQNAELNAEGAEVRLNRAEGAEVRLNQKREREREGVREKEAAATAAMVAKR